MVEVVIPALRGNESRENPSIVYKGIPSTVSVIASLQSQLGGISNPLLGRLALLVSTLVVLHRCSFRSWTIRVVPTSTTLSLPDETIKDTLEISNFTPFHHLMEDGTMLDNVIHTRYSLVHW